jgi:hypothetical protein
LLRQLDFSINEPSALSQKKKKKLANNEFMEKKRIIQFRISLEEGYTIDRSCVIQ